MQEYTWAEFWQRQKRRTGRTIRWIGINLLIYAIGGASTILATKFWLWIAPQSIMIFVPTVMWAISHMVFIGLMAVQMIKEEREDAKV